MGTALNILYLATMGLSMFFLLLVRCDLETSVIVVDLNPTYKQLKKELQNTSGDGKF